MKKMLIEQIKNLEEEIAKLKKVNIYYEDVLLKLCSSIKLLKSYANFLKQSSPDLNKLVDIVLQLNSLTKTQDFDYIENMQEYLKNNVDNKNWVKFNSLYQTSSKLLENNNELNEQYTAYAHFANIITNYEKTAYDSFDQIAVINGLVDEKQAKLSKLKEKYNSLNKNKKEENILKM